MCCQMAREEKRRGGWWWGWKRKGISHHPRHSVHSSHVCQGYIYKSSGDAVLQYAVLKLCCMWRTFQMDEKNAVPNLHEQKKKNNSKREIEKIDRNGIPLQLPKRPWLNFQMSHISFGRHQMCLKYVEENPKVFKSFFFFSLTRSVWVRSGGGWDKREKRTASEAQSSLQIASLPVLIQFRGIERRNTTAADWNAGGSSYSQKKKHLKIPTQEKNWCPKSCD